MDWLVVEEVTQVDVGLWAHIAGQAGAVPLRRASVLGSSLLPNIIGMPVPLHVQHNGVPPTPLLLLVDGDPVSVEDHQARVRPHARELLRPCTPAAPTCSASPTRSHSKRERFSWSVLSELVEETADQTGSSDSRYEEHVSIFTHRRDCRKETSVGGRLFIRGTTQLASSA